MQTCEASSPLVGFLRARGHLSNVQRVVKGAMETFRVRSVDRGGEWPCPGDLWGRNVYDDVFLF